MLSIDDMVDVLKSVTVVVLLMLPNSKEVTLKFPPLAPILRWFILFRLQTLFLDNGREGVNEGVVIVGSGGAIEVPPPPPARTIGLGLGQRLLPND